MCQMNGMNQVNNSHDLHRINVKAILCKSQVPFM